MNSLNKKLFVISDDKFKETYFFNYLVDHFNFSDSIILTNPDIKEINSARNQYNIENFHDITIKIEEFLPQILLYVCPLFSSNLIKEDQELSFLAYTELLNHLIDISLLGNYFIILIRSIDSHDYEQEKNFETGIANLMKYSRSLVIEMDYKDLNNEIKSKKIFDFIKKGKNNSKKLIKFNN